MTPLVFPHALTDPMSLTRPFHASPHGASQNLLFREGLCTILRIFGKGQGLVLACHLETSKSVRTESRKLNTGAAPNLCLVEPPRALSQGTPGGAGHSTSRDVDRVDDCAATRGLVPFHSSIRFVCVEELQKGRRGALDAIPRKGGLH